MNLFNGLKHYFMINKVVLWIMATVPAILHWNKALDKATPCRFYFY